ncbi:MAG: selenocysteine-specific translation elongation factor [Peptostreptococcaceae bacterium]|nr:selenocysteine-specific translation elongation factor [Peptostreptococcaceae bacterium]
MKNVVVGTAGHVDHGKTWLIKALTGTDTDRLIEEKRRGITIELGFTYMPNDENLDIGIIDVPGHEKFIKNMLAGAQGIDIVLLVVAADEGVMPQTVEHFDIVKSLGITKGIPVITKIDSVDEEMLSLVEDDINTLIKGTFLEETEIIKVSSKTMENIDYLKQEILSKAKEIGNKNTDKKMFRMPIDRIFSIKGFGTVVTGTMIEGSLSTGDEIVLYPSMLKAKVRNLQVHDKDVNSASAGQRTAINLTNLKKEDISRGDVLAMPNAMETSMIVDVSITLFENTKRRLKNNDRIHFYVGSKEMIAKVVLIGTDEIRAGQKAYAQLRLEEEIALKRNDPFIIRFFSPLETFGGGLVLNPKPKKHKRQKEESIEAFKLLDSNSETEALLSLIEYGQSRFPELTSLKRIIGDGTDELLKELIDDKKVIFVGECVVSEDRLNNLSTKIVEIFKENQNNNTLSLGIKIKELNSKISNKLNIENSKVVDEIIKILISKKVIVTNDVYLNLPGHSVKVDQSKLDDVLKAIDDQKFSVNTTKDNKDYLIYLEKKGALIRLGNDLYISKSNFDKAIDLFRKLSQKGGVSLGDFRDELNTSRKNALLILDAFDAKNITYKVENLRYFV